MPRRPARRTFLLGPPGPLERGLHSLFQKTPLHKLDPLTLHVVVAELIRALPSHRQGPMLSRVNRVCQENRFARWNLKDNKKVAGRAALVLRGQVGPRGRCDAVALLQHKEVALEHLDGLPRARYNLAHHTLALKDRLRRTYAAMARFPCSCRNAQTAPSTDTLHTWPRSLGALAVCAVAWHHRLRPSTARRLLAEAAAGVREIERRSRAPRS